MGKKRSHEDDGGVVSEKKSKRESTDNAAESQEADQSMADVSAVGVDSLTKLSYDDKVALTSPIAKPMASRKLAKKLFKLMKKANKKDRKRLLRVGLKEVQTRIRKGDTGMVVFAGDVTPIEVMCHMPGVCEEKGLPYCYVPLRMDISSALGMHRPTVMVMVRQDDDYGDLYQELEVAIKELPPVC